MSLYDGLTQPVQQADTRVLLRDRSAVGLLHVSSSACLRYPLSTPPPMPVAPSNVVRYRQPTDFVGL